MFAISPPPPLSPFGRRRLYSYFMNSLRSRIGDGSSGAAVGAAAGLHGPQKPGGAEHRVPLRPAGDGRGGGAAESQGRLPPGLWGRGERRSEGPGPGQLHRLGSAWCGAIGGRLSFA